MLKDLFTQKVLCLDVVQGLDVEKRLYLTGDTATVGSSRDDSLSLTDSGVRDAHLVLKNVGKDGWEFFAADGAPTQVSEGNARTGVLAPGLVIKVGAHTQIEVSRVGLPEDMKRAADEAEKKEVPMSVALPIMATMAGAVMFTMSTLAPSEAHNGRDLSVSRWFETPAAFTQRFDACLDHARDTYQTRRVPEASADAAFQAWHGAAVAGADGEGARRTMLKRAMGREVVDAHLLVTTGELDAARARLNHMQKMLPLRTQDCPVGAALLRDGLILDRELSR